MKRLVILAAALLAMGAVSFSAVEQDGKPNPKQLVGSWRMVSAKYDGQAVDIPADQTMVKHVTPEQFMWAVYDRKGRILAALGGSHEINGDAYAETAQYGLNADHLKGKTHRYKWRIEGNRWFHEGATADGVMIDEVWERVQKK